MTTTLDPAVADRDRRIVTLLGVLVGVLGLLAVGSTVVDVSPGAESVALVGLGGSLTALVWYAFGTPYAIAAGHVTLLALFPGGIDRTPFVFVLAEVVFLALLLAAGLRTPRPFRFAAVALVGTLGLAGAAWLALETQPIWVATVALFAVLGLATYSLHRYELVRLGLVSETIEPSEPIDTTDTTTQTDARTTTANAGGRARGRERP